MNVKIEEGRAARPTASSFVYSVAGTGKPALVFVHGGLANWGFWDGQLKEFAAKHRTIALDLPGHGESGSDRTKWGLPEFGADVKAVIDAEKADKVILFGNSLGGPVIIEAALLLGDRALGVVGVDTFQLLDMVVAPEEVRERAEIFEKDYAGALKSMVAMLFHKDADPAVVADAEKRMSGTPPAAAKAMFLGMAGYDQGASVRRLTVPLRTINGDLYPIDIEAGRKVKPDLRGRRHEAHGPLSPCSSGPRNSIDWSPKRSTA
ncbi:MAG: alpha/beta hydrolase [Candidatus Moduliflexus flocculans]|nr:alpha/beta hydrolase [Candidatus Moduliflexus flocculans]